MISGAVIAPNSRNHERAYVSQHHAMPGDFCISWLTSRAVRFLDLVKPFTPLIPEVQVPETKAPFQQRIIWTSVTLVIFLVMSQMPLYGIVSSGQSEVQEEREENDS